MSYDVAIVGGGIVGASIAAHLANEKINVVLINSTKLGMPASLAAAGMLTQAQLHELENPKLLDICFESFNYFKKFYGQITETIPGIDIGYRISGSLNLAFSQEELSQRKEEYEILKAFRNNLNISLLDKKTVYNLEPFVGDGVLGALHDLDEAFLNNPKLLKTIISYCIKNNVCFLDKKVLNVNISSSKQKIESISMEDGQILKAKNYVFANGVWVNNLLEQVLGLKNIIKAVKGEIVQLAVPEVFQLERILVSNYGYVLPRPATSKFEKNTIIVGSTLQEVDLADGEKIFKNTAFGMSSILATLTKLLPNAMKYPIVNNWTGLRPRTSDALPIIGQCSELSNLYLALGHYRNGILLGPYTGKLISELILNGKTQFNIDPFGVERLFKNSTVKV